MTSRARSRAQADEHVSDEFRAGLLDLLPHLRAFARGLCGRPDLADDLVQDTVMRAWAARGSYTDGTNLRAWAFTIMRNHYLNELRRRGRVTEIDEGAAEALLVMQADQEEALHVDDLQKALDQLPHDRREALLLVGAGGFTYEEAAGVCGVPVGTMKSRVARGRAQLANILEDGGHEMSARLAVGA